MICLAAILLACVPALFAAPGAGGRRSPTFNPFTFYIVLGKCPKGLADFRAFGLSRHSGSAGRPPKVEGFS